MKIYNSLTRKKEEFVPIKKRKVGIYTCGPTVYNYQHIGNFRTMILSDTLRRVLVYSGYKVKLVRNITDIDDKTIMGAAKNDVTLAEFTKEYTKIFFDDLQKLNSIPADVDTIATDYIPQMIDFIEGLVKKGIAYVEDDGSVYFDISKFEDYGKLSRIENRSLKTGTRILSDEYSKDNAQDFALWKSVKESDVGYDSPWGKGRPGWHIECSAMSRQQFGDTFDIHVGGVDLLFPHHENEIAQSEGLAGKKFVNYFVHGEYLQVDGRKMSKSLNNFYTIKDLENRGFDPIVLRYFYLSGHYRKKLNFTWEALESAQTGLNKLRKQVVATKAQTRRTATSEDKNEKVVEFQNKFEFAISDDLNMPQALAVVWEVLKSNISPEDKYDLVISFDEVLGLDLKNAKEVKTEIPSEVIKLAEERKTARDGGDFDKGDKIREKVERMGYGILDQGEKYKIAKRE